MSAHNPFAHPSCEVPADVRRSPETGAVGLAQAADSAKDVAWDLGTLLQGETVDELVNRADLIADDLTQWRGKIADIDTPTLIAIMRQSADMNEALGRAGYYVSLRYSVDTADPERGAHMMAVQERSTAIGTKLVFLELEWADLDDDLADAHLADPGLEFCAHYLRSARRYRPHLLGETEEQLLSEKQLSGSAAWVRLFDEQTSAIEVELPDGVPGGPGKAGLEQGLALLASNDANIRSQAGLAVSTALQPGLRTRSFIYNTLALDKATDDRLRHYSTWVSSRNLANETTDDAVTALIDAVVARYDIPQRWYGLKAQVLGVDKLTYADRSASLATVEQPATWEKGKATVLDAYNSFSPELAGIAQRFFDESWIDAPVRESKSPGAFCAYTVAEHHPYILLNWTGRARDVATLAHELGHGLHAYLARPQGDFHQSTPLTLAETASVFGETVTSNRLLASMDDPNARFALLATTLEDSIATVFRQTAMFRFEAEVHNERRTVGELSTARFGELWATTQSEMLGDAVDFTDEYRSWWSYIPHFIATPGYVYAYAFGQLFALSVYARYEALGAAFVPSYLELLKAGGSLPPVELGKIVDCDLDDPGFWDGGLNIIAGQLDATVEAARAAGRMS